MNNNIYTHSVLVINYIQNNSLIYIAINFVNVLNTKKTEIFTNNKLYFNDFLTIRYNTVL